MKVLVVEDDPASLEVIQMLLNEPPFEVIPAETGKEGQAYIESSDEQAIIALLDWNLPDIEGIELCRLIRKRRPDRRDYIIILTANVATEYAVEALRAEANDFVRKPEGISEELKLRLHAGVRYINERQILIAESITDPLTGAFNRRGLDNQLEIEAQRSEREASPFSVLLADLDSFKQVNDLYGHALGDHVLRQTVQRIKKSVRRYDIVGRYGGEELLVLSPYCTDEVALHLGERIRRQVVRYPMRVFSKEHKLFVSVSIGTATLLPGEDSRMLMQRADTALYAAKKGGRNKVISAQASAVMAL